MRETKLKKGMAVSFKDSTPEETPGRLRDIAKTFIWAVHQDGKSFLILHPNGEFFNEQTKDSFAGFDTSVLSNDGHKKYLAAKEEELTALEVQPQPTTAPAPIPTGRVKNVPQSTEMISIEMPKDVWEFIAGTTFGSTYAFADRNSIQAALMKGQGLDDATMDYMEDFAEIFFQKLNEKGIPKPEMPVQE